MASLESLSTLFEEFGFELSAPIIEKCLDLCINFDISDPREFVELYVAFSVNHLNGAEPTLDTLNEFERKELHNCKNKGKDVSRTNITQHRNLNDFEQFDCDDIDDADADDLMDAYICNTPKTEKKRQLHVFNTPRPDAIANSPIYIGSPISTTSKDVSGKVIYTFGISALTQNINWMNAKQQNVKIVPFSDNNKTLSPNVNYMYDTLLEKCTIAADRIFDIGKDICIKLIQDRPTEYNEELYDNMSHVDIPHQTTIKCIGRICSDSDCELALHSTIIVGADEMKLRTARMNFNRMKSFSLFPGQTVLAKGFNPRGDTFFVDEIFAERNLKYADTPKLDENLYIAVAAGPYTFANDLNYEPINDLLAYCIKHKPDVLILIGPFLDADHRLVQDCSMKCSFETYFDNLISRIMEAIGTDIEVIVVSAGNDAHSTMVYPTHPYSIRQSYKNLTFLPDPCTVTINGVTIGISSTDILTHILEAELAVNVGDKVRRAVNYLFNQGSFYPLNPPSDKTCLDIGLTQNFASLMTIPNVLILPSSMKCFIRDLNNCLVVNPGQLSEAAARGTFGRMMVTPSADQKILNNYVACQIIKL